MSSIENEVGIRFLRKEGKVGRRMIEFTDDAIKKAEVLAGRGLTFEQIANYFGIGKTTFYRKMNENPELEMALLRGKAKTISMVSGKLLEQINDGNVPATIFYLRTQARWTIPDSDKDQESDHNNQETQKLETGSKRS